jgi:hypothetical protein
MNQFEGGKLFLDAHLARRLSSYLQSTSKTASCVVIPEGCFLLEFDGTTVIGYAKI